jgi:hypothetical protein
VRVVKSIKLCLAAMCGAVLVCGAILAGVTASAGQARADVPPATLPPPLEAPAGGLKLTEVSAGTWKTTIYLDTAALCLGTNEFNLVTAVPYSSTIANPDYPDGLRCPAQDADPLTKVVLVFTPSAADLTSVPQTATLTVTPPVTAMAAGDPPLEVPLTVRRIVTANQYVWIPVGCGLVLAALLVGLIAAIGVRTAAGRFRGWQRGFWRAPMSASATWTFGDSWATNTAGVTALVAAVLSASGSIGGLIPGVDLGRFGLMMAVAVGVVGIAPLFFGVLNSWFIRQNGQSGQSEPPGAAKPEVVVSKMWAMLAASFLTVSGIGAELGIVGWVLGYDLMVAPAYARWISVIVAVLLALGLLLYGIRAAVTLADPKGGSPLNPPKSAAFIL